MPQRLGILGGTFDPVHMGHLRSAEEAAEVLNLDQVLFVPGAAPPHKPGCEVLAFEHRWAMLQLAIAENPRFGLSDIEHKLLPGRSYTVNTMRRLKEELPGAELFFLVGLDAFFEIDSWFLFTELFRLAEIVVLGRPGFNTGYIEDFLSGKVSSGYVRDPGDWTFRHPEMCSVYCLRNTRLDISSTRIRGLVAEGGSIRYLVPREVVGYIYERRLYRDIRRDCQKKE